MNSNPNYMYLSHSRSLGVGEDYMISACFCHHLPDFLLSWAECFEIETSYMYLGYDLSVTLNQGQGHSTEI